MNPSSLITTNRRAAIVPFTRSRQRCKPILIPSWIVTPMPAKRRWTCDTFNDYGFL